MAIYRLSAQIIRRSGGEDGKPRTVTAAAAYRAGVCLVDECTGQVFDFTHKAVDDAVILLPDRAPAWMSDRSALWNAVEKIEKREKSQLAREVQLALPVELSKGENWELALDFVQRAFVDKGMIADVAFHKLSTQPHAHVLLTMRDVGPEGFGKKNRDWNDRKLLLDWRKDWEIAVNAALENAGSNARVDSRNLKDQVFDAVMSGDLDAARALDRLPQPKFARGERGERQRAQFQQRAAVYKAERDLEWAALEAQAAAEARLMPPSFDTKPTHQRSKGPETSHNENTQLDRHGLVGRPDYVTDAGAGRRTTGTNAGGNHRKARSRIVRSALTRPAVDAHRLSDGGASAPPVLPLQARSSDAVFKTGRDAQRPADRVRGEATGRGILRSPMHAAHAYGRPLDPGQFGRFGAELRVWEAKASDTIAMSPAAKAPKRQQAKKSGRAQGSNGNGLAKAMHGLLRGVRDESVRAFIQVLLDALAANEQRRIDDERFWNEILRSRQPVVTQMFGDRARRRLWQQHDNDFRASLRKWQRAKTEKNRLARNVTQAKADFEMATRQLKELEARQAQAAGRPKSILDFGDDLFNPNALSCAREELQRKAVIAAQAQRQDSLLARKTLGDDMAEAAKKAKAAREARDNVMPSWGRAMDAVDDYLAEAFGHNAVTPEGRRQALKTALDAVDTHIGQDGAAQPRLDVHTLKAFEGVFGLDDEAESARSGIVLHDVAGVTRADGTFVPHVPGQNDRIVNDDGFRFPRRRPILPPAMDAGPRPQPQPLPTQKPPRPPGFDPPAR